MSTLRAARPLLAALTWTAVVAGCDVYADPVDNGSASGNIPTPSSADLLSGEDGGSTTQVFCPGTRPVDDTQCDVAGSVCEYGGTPDITCNPRVECVASGVDEAGASFGETTLLPSAWITDPAIGGCVVHTCPGTFAEITPGSACDAPTDAGASAEYLCGYPEGLCGCSTGPDGSHAHARRWDCAPLPASPCPAERPHIGAACGNSDLTCDYGSCLWKHGTAVHCDGASWQATEVPCE